MCSFPGHCHLGWSFFGLQIECSDLGSVSEPALEWITERGSFPSNALERVSKGCLCFSPGPVETGLMIG